MKHLPSSAGEWRQCSGYAKKMLLTEADLHAEGAVVQLIEIAPRTSVAEHYHKRCTEVFHVLAGYGTFLINGQTIHLRPGDTLTCEPGEVHNTTHPGDVPFTYIVFKTNAEPDDIYWVD